MGGEAVFIDDSGNYYMNDINGQLHYFDLHRDVIYHFSVLETNLINKPDTHPIQVTTDHNGYIWIITKGNGFFIYDPSTRQLQHFSPREKGVSPIETDYIQAIMNDHSCNIWISQENMGISVLSTMPRGITRLFADDGLTPNYSNFFRMVRETADGKLWAGNFTGSSFQILQEAKGEDYRFSSIDIGVRDDMLAICKDRQGHQWIGTRNKGISVDGHFYQNIPNDTTSLPRGKVFDILCDTRGRVWVAVNTGALCLAIPQTDGSYKFRRFLTENSFMRTVTVLHQTKTGHILVGCANGLVVFHPDSIAPVGGRSIPTPTIITTRATVRWVITRHATFMKTETRFGWHHQESGFTTFPAKTSVIRRKQERYSFSKSLPNRDWLTIRPIRSLPTAREISG